MIRYTDWARELKLNDALFKRKYIVDFEVWRLVQLRWVGSFFYSNIKYFKI